MQRLPAIATAAQRENRMTLSPCDPTVGAFFAVVRGAAMIRI
jgi:hypothetical protein